jgi:DNA processing protein
MALDPDLEAWLALSAAPGLTNDAFRQLLVAFHGPQEIRAASRAELSRVVADRAVRAVLAPAPRELLDKTAAWLEDPLNHIVTLGDTTYPQALLQAADPPPLLYAKGRLELLNAPAFAIVGSRNATQHGLVHGTRPRTAAASPAPPAPSRSSARGSTSSIPRAIASSRTRLRAAAVSSPSSRSVWRR